MIVKTLQKKSQKICVILHILKLVYYNVVVFYMSRENYYGHLIFINEMTV